MIPDDPIYTGDARVFPFYLRDKEINKQKMEGCADI
jgi:hypothetical protein